jgi:hypothetical protein
MKPGRLWIGALAAALSLIAAAPSTASTSVGVAGSITPTSTTYTSVRSDGGNTIIDGFGTLAWSGDLTGTSVVYVHFVIHADGQVTYEGHITFTGTTPCGSGVVQFEAQGQGPFPGPLAGKATATAQGSSTLAMHVKLDTTLFLTPNGAAGSYSGDVTCS